jgi:hypothetical protein
MTILKAIARLYFIHIFAFLAVGLSIYYPPWDIVLAVLYLLIIGVEAYSLRNLSIGRQLAITLAWQGPGILLFLGIISGLKVWDLSNYAFFIMQFWYTPLLPFLSLLPRFIWRGSPLYYYGLLTLPFLMAAYHLVIGNIMDTKADYHQ